MNENQEHEYLRRIRLAMEICTIPKDQWSHVHVSHDEHCERETGLCACDPDITIRVDEGVLHLHKDGSLILQPFDA